MRAPASALAWDIALRHRWGFAGLGLYFAVLAAIRLALLGLSVPIAFDDAGSFAFATIVPMTGAIIFLLGAFSFGLAGDLARRRSTYPERLFALPVTSTALAGWPMLFGGVAMAVLWLLTRVLGPWPSELRMPLVWPALMGVVMLAWVQALTWMPYPLPGLRVLVSVFWLSAVGVTIVVALELEAPEGAMLAMLAPHVPVAFLVARRAVTRARRGEVPDWSRFVPRLDRRSGPTSSRRFSSPSRAQEWLEWRRHGRSLPVLVACVLPFELWLLWVFPETPAIVREVLLAALLTPPFMAAFAAANVSRSAPGESDAWELTPFVATRPLTSAGLVSAKLRTATRSTLAAWLVVLAALPLAFSLSGTAGVVADDAHRLGELIGGSRATVLAALVVSASLLATWRTLVAGLYIGMSGRAWLVKGSVFATLVALTMAVALVPRVLASPERVTRIWHALPWILGALVAAKLVAAAWIAFRLRETGLVSDRALIAGLVGWDLAVLSLTGLLAWLVPALVFRVYGFGLVAILAIPLARVAGVPLMAAWNRHR